MKRGGGGPNAQQAPRMTFPHGGGFVAHQQPQQVIQARPQQAPYTNYRAPQLRMPTMINRSGQMSFQQPPPSVTGQQPPGPQQPPQPQTSQQPQNNFVGHQGIIQQQQTPMFTLNPSMFNPQLSGAGVRQAYIYSGVNPALYPQHGVYPQPQHIHGTHPGYNQPPPNIPNQHPRPQTPPSAATATVNPTGAPGGHSINITTPQGIYINQTPQTPHYAQQQTTQPPPQVSVASQPNPVAHTTYPSVMQPTQSKPPLEKRKRNPIQIIDPNTMKEVAVSDGPSKSSSVAASEAKPSENDEVPETGIAPSASVKTSTTVEDKSSPSPVQNEIPEIKSVEQNSRERTISVTSAPDQAAVPEPIEVAVEADTANNNKEESSSSSQIKIHPASSSNDGSLGNDSEIQVEDSKSKQRNKKDAVKSTDVCTNESKAVESTEGQKEVTPEVTEAVENKQPSKEPSVSIELAQNDVQQEQQQQQPPSNHVVENHISETISEDTTTNVIIEETDDNTAAVENGNGSAASSAPASKSSSQIKLKYQYPEDQWSPIFTEGKKQYGREFLVMLATDPMSMRKPENLPSMDIIKDAPNQDRNRALPPGSHQSKDWTPGFVKSTTSKSGMNTKGGSRDRSAKRPGNVTVIDLNINKDIELNKAENAWKPAMKAGPVDTAEKDPLTDLQGSVRAILNKLTPQNFDKLVKKQFNELTIDSESKLKACIELIFEKAVDEPEFCVAYARMCEVLRSKKVHAEARVSDGPSKQVDFQRMMIGRCQKEFERDYMEGFDKASFEANLAAAESEERKKEMQLEYEDKERRARRRSLGNIRFIGELYNLRMLTDRIMHEIIRKLINQTDEESLECLCWLLNTTGKQLEAATEQRFTEAQIQNKQGFYRSFDDYFDKMDKLAKDKDKFPARVRFMLQDVIDLRQNKWKPRREKAGPKTLDQIHKEAEIEKTQQQLMDLKVGSSGGGGGGGGGNHGGNRDGGRRGKGSQRGNQPQQSNDENDWNTVPMRQQRANNERIDMTKLPTSSRKDADTMTFGPSRPGWGKGSGYAPKPSSQNRFANMQNFESAANSEAAPARQKYSASMGNFTRSSRNDERQEAIDAVKNIGRNTNGPTSNVMGPSPTPKDIQSSQQQVAGGPSMSMDAHNLVNHAIPNSKNEVELIAEQLKQLSGSSNLEDDKVKRKAKSILEEYLLNCDAESAYNDVCSDFHPSHMILVVEEIIVQVLEQTKIKALTMAGQLLDTLVSKYVLLPKNMEEGLCNLLKYGSDMELDIPKFWEYIGTIIAPMLISGRSLSMNAFLLDTKIRLWPQSHVRLDDDQVLKYLAGVFKAMINLDGFDPAKVGELWNRSGLQLTQFMPPEEVSKFITTHKLDFIDSQPDAYIKVGLRPLLVETSVKNDAVLSWIEENVPKEELSSNAFIRTLTRVVTESQIDAHGSGLLQLNENNYADRCLIVKRYVDSDLDREKQALYALQHLMQELEHPTKLLTTIFSTLYNNDVISDDGFEAWLNCNDPAEQEGKGVATKATTHFFTWMKENIEENEDVEENDD